MDVWIVTQNRAAERPSLWPCRTPAMAVCFGLAAATKIGDQWREQIGGEWASGRHGGGDWVTWVHVPDCGAVSIQFTRHTVRGDGEESGGRADLYRRAAKAYGHEAQAWMLVEECGELLDAAAKTRRDRADCDELVKECADVIIMCEQLAMITGATLDDLDAAKSEKLDRLRDRVTEHERGER